MKSSRFARVRLKRALRFLLQCEISITKNIDAWATGTSRSDIKTKTSISSETASLRNTVGSNASSIIIGERCRRYTVLPDELARPLIAGKPIAHPTGGIISRQPTNEVGADTWLHGRFRQFLWRRARKIGSAGGFADFPSLRAAGSYRNSENPPSNRRDPCTAEQKLGKPSTEGPDRCTEARKLAFPATAPGRGKRRAGGRGDSRTTRWRAVGCGTAGGRGDSRTTRWRRPEPFPACIEKQRAPSALLCCANLRSHLRSRNATANVSSSLIPTARFS